ncbi:hypothetical protein [Pseudactinotalea sp.]|uniref:hypothetical protein n=1 Tax=Pseudactinotalea sp. TaxID=1926260 RepID=UPI003B3A170D
MRSMRVPLPRPAADGTPGTPRRRHAHLTTLPRARGPVSGALFTLLTGPPIQDPGILMSNDLTDLWWTPEAPWWEADDDVALALVCLDELDRRGLAGVSAGWESHPLLATVRWRLSSPIERGLERLRQDSTIPTSSSGCITVRHVLAMIATAPEPVPAGSGSGREEPMEEAAVLTAVQRLRERDAHLSILPMLAGTSRQLLQRAALTVEPPGMDDATREVIGRVLRAFGVPDRTGAHLSAMSGAALWRLAAMQYLATRRSLRAATLGWLVAADALAASGRVVSGSTLRAHGLDDGTAKQWDRCVIGDLAVLEAAEHVIDCEPRLADDLILGARACLTSATAVEDSLADRAGRRDELQDQQPATEPQSASTPTDLTPTEGLI